MILGGMGRWSPQDSVPNMMIKDWEFKQHGPVKGIGDDGGFGPADQDR